MSICDDEFVKNETKIIKILNFYPLFCANQGYVNCKFYQTVSHDI